jgi:magnesium transporter
MNLDFKKSNYALKKELKSMQAYDIAEVFSERDSKEQLRVFNLIGVRRSSEVFSRLSKHQQIETFKMLPKDRKTQILNNLEVDELKEFIAYFDEEEQENVLSFVSVERANIIKDLLIYSSDTAPSIMTTQFLTINVDTTVKKATSYIFNNVKEDDFIDNIYVIDEEENLVGVLALKDLIIARADDEISELMNSEYHFIYSSHTIKEAIEIVKNYDLTSLPVVDHQGYLLGIITADDVLEQLINNYDELYNRLAFLPKHDESYSGFERSKKRLPWLLITTILNILIAFLFIMVPAFELTLSEVFALVLFQPLVLDMAGNIGTQNLAVTILGIHRDELSSKDDRRKFLKKELLVIVFNCLISALVGFAIVALFSFITKQVNSAGALIHPAKLGLTVAIALFSGMFISGLLGTLLPILFAKRDMDSDNASGPILTTLADIIAILTYYIVASIMLLFM